MDKWAQWRCDGVTCHATVGSEKVPSFCMSCHWCWKDKRYVNPTFDPTYKPELPTEQLFTEDYNTRKLRCKGT